MSILIVEDNPISLRTMEMILQSNGLETISARSGIQALAKLREHEDVQLVLTDIMMPELDGYGLLEEMSRDLDLKDVPVVVMTSLSDAETVRKVVSLGCKGYVVKPVREESLVPKVRQAMREPAGGSEGSLKPKFKVLEETGLAPARYDELLDGFHADLQATSKAVAELAEIPTPEQSGAKALLELIDGASALATGRLPTLLEGYRNRGTCDWAQLKDALRATLQAVDAAVEKRSRLREKLARTDVSTFPSED